MGTNKKLNQYAQIRNRLNNPNLSNSNKLILGKILQALKTELTKAGLGDNIDDLSVSLVTEARENIVNTPASAPTSVPMSTPASDNSKEGVIGNLLINADESIQDNIEANTPEADHIDSSLGTTTGIIYNEAQRTAIQYAGEGKSFVLTGAAGSGKTTTVEGIINKLITSNRAGVLQNDGHKHLKNGTPAIVVISFTNKAVANVKKRLPIDLRDNCITSHKLLEYEPEYFEVDNPSNGTSKTSMRFVPTRTARNPNPASITTLIIDEATMTDVVMWNNIIRSLPKRDQRDLQVILVGDIQQLPPVFGKSIFIHAMQKGMLTVELTEIHRQAMDSPILALAHRVLSGKVIPPKELEEWNIDKTKEGLGKLTIQAWKKTHSEMYMLRALDVLLPNLIDSGAFDYKEDVILCPQNVGIGVLKINQVVATKVAKDLDAEVFEVFSGTEKKYFRIGDRVLHNKTEHIITGIRRNNLYFGRPTRPPSTTMDYMGVEHVPEKLRNASTTSEAPEGMSTEEWVDSVLEAISGSPQDEDSPSKRAASHIIELECIDTQEKAKCANAGEINQLLLAYAITVHRSQGSEYRRVLILLHKVHAGMLSRELLYVAITRAKEELFILCEKNSFIQGITSQKLVGASIKEKIANFDKWVTQSQRGSNSKSNDEQVPIGLHRFIPTVTEEDGEYNETAQLV